MEEEKKAIRKRLRGERAALDADAVSRAGRAVVDRLLSLAVYRAAREVLIYAATDNEVPTPGVIRDALASGKCVYLPRISARTFVRYSPPEPLRRGPWGIPEPAGGCTFRGDGRGALVLLPLVAWTLGGERLGRGGGWYDRVLARVGEQAAKVGLGYEFQRCGVLPQIRKDIPLDFVITERRVVCCEPRRNVGGVAGRRNT